MCRPARLPDGENMACLRKNLASSHTSACRSRGGSSVEGRATVGLGRIVPREGAKLLRWARSVLGPKGYLLHPIERRIPVCRVSELNLVPNSPAVSAHEHTAGLDCPMIRLL
jgi:hypothetical protein